MGSCVMIVDDDDSTRVLLERIVRTDGHRVVSASGGWEALARLHDAEPLPDLVLLDLTMPGMDGMELFERMRAEPRLAQVPVVLLTARGDVANFSGLPPVPAMLHKPVDEEVLRGVVGALLAQGERLRFSLDESPSDLMPRFGERCPRSLRPSA